MSITQRNDIQISGSGKRSMVLAHGFGCDQSMWRFLAPSFQGEYRTVLFE
ncbi:MAG TPA: alpha/beta hydrolase [Paraburkholderia sp.]|nr:alpha/beta hydrolase [Paraburkholderia sp.]